MDATRAVGIPVFVLGLAVIGYAVAVPGTTLWEVRTHETTEGTVLSTNLKGVQVQNHLEYYPQATYRYTVDGKTYRRGGVYHPWRGEKGVRHRLPEDARAAFDDANEGDTVTVHYDPDDPSTSYLVDPREALLWRVGGFGVVGFLVAEFGGLHALGMLPYQSSGDGSGLEPDGR